MPSTNLLISPPVIAHRGASAEAPENTMAAFLRAKQLGLKWVEFDVMLASCGEVVLFHDDDLFRTTSIKGRIIEHPYEYLKTLDAGNWFNPTFKNERIPTLVEVLKFLSENNMAANIEIKPFVNHKALLVKSVLEIIKDNAIPIWLSSFSYVVLEEIYKQSPHVPLGFLMHTWQQDWQLKCRSINAIIIGINHALLNEKRVKEVKEEGSKLYLCAYTVNDPFRAKELLMWGVDAIFSDCPPPIIQAFTGNSINPLF